jgi:hypothetical protein
MYWTRADSLWGFAPWLLMSALWFTGGVLVCTAVFRLAARERLVCGLGVGLLLHISLSNLVAHFTTFPVALWAGAGLVLAIGLWGAWRAGWGKKRSRETFRLPALERPVELHSGLAAGFARPGWLAWGAQTRLFVAGQGVLLLFLVLLTLFFGQINRGLAIFDDYHNLPLISLMAAGDVPPHFYLNTANRMAYHYGWHLFAASLVRVGDLFPWSAFDIAKAFSLAYLGVLAWLWFRRWTRSRAGAVAGALLVLLGGGSRWLLLFLSPDRLRNISAAIVLQGTSAASGPDLAANLSGPWLIEGDGLLPFPFAFANGIFPPGVMALGGSGAIPLATFFLLLLLAPRRWQPAPAALFSLLLASLALTAEYLFAPLVAGLGLAALAGFLQSRSHPGNTPPTATRHTQFGYWLALLACSALLAFIQGGLVTEMIRRWLARLGGGLAAEGSGFIGFTLRWPPALVSAHLGTLSLADPWQVLVGLAEIGPVLLLAPWVSVWAWKQWRRGSVLLAGAGAAALIGFLAPVFVQYAGRDRDITHMTGAALFLWMAAAFPLVWIAILRGRRWLRAGLVGGTAITIFGGLVLLAFQMLVMPRPQFTTFVTEEDAALSSLYWNRLEPGAQILDPIPHRAITLFGLGGGQAYKDFFMPLPEWKALLVDPEPARIARAGYTFIYHDQEWWGGLTRQQKDRFKNDCVRQVNRGAKKGADMRRLLDVRMCK